ncbi:lung adenoma susceptibility protein 2 isoform X3 [Betta splendens]|uniref:Lung adenoma susceptibility protein 2 isoform X3 n=1 Tax=Betta splendens TaxID=158456 RepID=A0A6P7P6Q7_BETSP|nr:lung adenoma susceptibility protein 2 isoform X3 [Betta splendens]
MDSGSLDGDVLSPESTVTSLLSSSGHLRSSLLPPDHSSSFRYRDRDYDSASAALDAYIADFELSHCDRGPRKGLVLPRVPPAAPSRPRGRTLRNRDVLRESLTERELDFLNLPVSSLRHRDNRDRLSMTTDELLCIPPDGSMPVTHTSAFIYGLNPRSGASQLCFCSSGSRRGACARLSSSCRLQMPQTCRCKEKTNVNMSKSLDNIRSESKFKRVHRAGGPDSLSLHLPHWVTSNKADLDCSGMSSVPDLTYPAWIQHCDPSERWDRRAPRVSAPSWVAELEDDDSHQISQQVDNQQILKDLRLQFAEQISLLTTERKNSDVVENLFRDNRFESLIQKADEVLHCLSQSSGPADSSPAGSVSPVKTEDLLCSSLSRRPFFSLESTATAGGATEALTDRGAQAHGDSIWKQPGPLEALKQMLFKLQAVETELQRQQAEASKASKAPAAPAARAACEPLQTEVNVITEEVSQRPEGVVELEGLSGGVCLQRALHHLHRLKLLVEEPGSKSKPDEVKDEDEGHYSSSSADGLCPQQKPA